MDDHHRQGEIDTTEEKADCVRREWFEVPPGGEAVDVMDLAGQFVNVAGREMWLSRAELEETLLEVKGELEEACKQQPEDTVEESFLGYPDLSRWKSSVLTFYHSVRTGRDVHWSGSEMREVTDRLPSSRD